jgi:translation factor GUF1, mitochondrial
VYREKGNKERVQLISNPVDFPDAADSSNRVKEIQEPIVKATIIVPEGVCIPKKLPKIKQYSHPQRGAEYLGEMMDLCFAHRGEDVDYQYLEGASNTEAAAEASRIIMTANMPLSEIVTDFFDKLKSRSSGFASFE